MAQATFVYDPTTARFQTELRDVYRVLRDELPGVPRPRRAGSSPSPDSPTCGTPSTTGRRSPTTTWSKRDALMPQMIYMDPPRHTELRALVSRAFTPKRIADLEPRIREVARELIDRFAGTRPLRPRRRLRRRRSRAP